MIALGQIANMTRIMYIERKAGELTGAARIGRVTFSKNRKTLHYRGKQYRSLHGRGFKANEGEVESGEEYWISGCRRDGNDRLYGERVPVYTDDDVREEYWTEIRKQPETKLRQIANQQARGGFSLAPQAHLALLR